MNKEIIHQAAQAHAEKSFIQPLNAQGEVMSIPTGHTVPYGRKHKLAENILKPEYFGIKNNSLNQQKPLIKKESKTWFSVNCWPKKKKIIYEIIQKESLSKTKRQINQLF
jgi:hypothetical protein